MTAPTKIIKLHVLDAREDPGPIYLPGVKVGDVVSQVLWTHRPKDISNENDSTVPFDSFLSDVTDPEIWETTISVDDQLQQLSSGWAVPNFGWYAFLAVILVHPKNWE